MKKIVLQFIHRGFIACGIGPIALAVVYLIMDRYTDMHSISVSRVVIGIFSLSALAFIAGGMNAIYQIERLPLSVGILIHGAVLYVSYLITYLLNDWIKKENVTFLVFTGIFVVGYLVIWAVIYLIIRGKIKRINKSLNEKRHVEMSS